MSILGSLSAFGIFLGIAAIGFLFLIVSFAFGEVFSHGDTGGHDASRGTDQTATGRAESAASHEPDLH